MPFDKVETQIDFPAQERAVLAFWQQHHIFEKLIEQNRGKPKWSFLDGPITANNPMGVHHAWGRTYKDAFQRYFAMTGHEQRYQNGFDCQGLWVEVEVEKTPELKLQSKKDIENLVPGDRFASIDKFVQMCKDRVDKYARIQTEQSIRLGYWMDWDREEDWRKPPGQRRSYFTMSEENNYTIWSFLKKCFERGLVYKGYDAMPWCPRCAVGVSQQEMHEGYFQVAHRAVFVRFPLRERQGENLLVWTTTPWTLSSNVGAAVNPELTYLKVKQREQIHYLAKDAFTFKRLDDDKKLFDAVGVPRLKTLEQHFKEKGPFEIVGELKGADMLGWAYDGPFDELDAQAHASGYPEEIADVVTKQQWAPAQGAKELHRVIAWSDVGATEGTGIVHIAPGCGKEDFALGKQEKLPPVAPLDEEGLFHKGFGPLAGKSAVDPTTTDWILDNLKQKELLVAVEKYPHSYPHCWRCKTELLFRLVDEWFIDMKWRDEIIAVTEQVTFLPESINGKAREKDWLQNMGDWMISKKRFWGLALPIWVCAKCDHFEVIGGQQELKERAVEGWDRFEGHSPHRPWLDLVKIKCAKCGEKASRIPDVGNPWLDAGIVPYSTMHYNTNPTEWEKWFPADLITECFPGQFRNWFYAILAMSTMMANRPPFKVLLGHGLVRDQGGDEMHKSKGNAIAFNGAADDSYDLFCERDPKLKPDKQAARDLPAGFSGLEEKPQRVDKREFLALFGTGYPPMGADLMRWLYCRHNPALNINFGPGPAAELRARFVLKLWNTYAFFVNYARIDDFDPGKPQVPVQERPDLDRWILSDLQLLIRTAHKSFTEFDVKTFCLDVESFVDDKLSNWYVRRNRRRFWKSEHGSDKLSAYQTLYTALTTLTKLIAPIVPFLSETIYRNLVDLAKEKPSVHLCEYPQVDEALIDADLSADMEALLRLVSLGSAARNKRKIKVRQPLAKLVVQSTETGSAARAINRFADQIQEELNVKAVEAQGPLHAPKIGYEILLDKKSCAPKFGRELDSLQQEINDIIGSLGDAQFSQILFGGFLSNTSYALNSEALNIIKNSYSGPKMQLFDQLVDGDIVVRSADPVGWASVSEPGIVVAIDIQITDELKLEGLARDIVRQVQDLRKKAGLEMEDRVVLHLSSEDAQLAAAIKAHAKYIADETLTVKWSEPPLSGADLHEAAVKIEGKAFKIQLRKA